MRPELRLHPVALLSAARGRWRALFQRDALDRALAEETSFHLAMEVEKNLRAGMTYDDAYRAARIAFGGADRVAEAHRDARGVRLIEHAAADLRLAARALAHNPGFVTVSVATLGTAIAIGTMLFTAANGFFNRPLPVPDGGDLIAVFTSDFSARERRGGSSYADLIDFASAAEPVAELAGHARVVLGVGVHDDVAMARGSFVSPGYFRLLRVRPSLGRFPDASQESPAVVLGHSLWRRRFGSDTSLVGGILRVNGQPFTVVAVAVPEFRGTSRESADEFWIPVAHAPLVSPGDDILGSRTDRRFHVLARLRDGMRPDALDGRLSVIAAQLFDAHPVAWRDTTGSGRVVTTIPEREAHLANVSTAERLLIIAGVTALGLALLAIASTNLASMQMARASARRREIATRLALGASRGRLIAQLLAECALIIVAGAFVGIILTIVVTGLVARYQPFPLPSVDLSLDWRAAAFVGGALVLVLLIFGLVPALQAVRSDLLSDLKGGPQPGAGGIRVGGIRGGLIVTQVALSLLFTAAAGMGALALVHNAGIGRDGARDVLLARINFLPAAGDSAAVRNLTETLIADMSSIPGVERASAAEFIPVRGTRRTVGAEIRTPAGESKRLVLDANAVGPAYFDVVGLQLMRGRDFEPRDLRVASPVVIVSRAMADVLWPDEDPVGRRMTIDARGRTESAEVIGVVADQVGQGPATPESHPGLVYLPMSSNADSELVLHVRAPTAPSTIAVQIGRRLRAEHSRLAAGEIMSLDDYYDRALLPQRLLAHASSALAALQTLLAIAGLSGLVAYVTALRQREIGIRTALGATRSNVLWLMMRQGIHLTIIGGALGLVLSIVVSRILALSLPMTSPIVLGALAGAAMVFAATGAVAMWLPARRALAVAPAAALRVD